MVWTLRSLIEEVYLTSNQPVQARRQAPQALALLAKVLSWLKLSLMWYPQHPLDVCADSPRHIKDNVRATWDSKLPKFAQVYFWDPSETKRNKIRSTHVNLPDTSQTASIRKS